MKKEALPAKPENIDVSDGIEEGRLEQILNLVSPILT